MLEARAQAQHVRDRIIEDAADRGVRPARLVDALVAMPFAGAVVVVAAWADRPFFHLLTDDDRILEWLQFVGYAAATGIGAWIALTFRRRGNKAMTAIYALFTGGCFVIAGDEVSWGQRIFGWGTPAALDRINKQDETTIHNIAGVSTLTNLVMLLMGAVGFAVPWLALRYRDRLPRDLTRYVVPPLFLTAAFLMLFVYKGLRFTLFTEPQSATVSFGEWPEFCLAYALSALAFLTARRVVADQRAAEHAPAAPTRRPTAPPAPASRRSRHARSRVT